jgi:polysaccharide export outer membrane protein
MRNCRKRWSKRVLVPVLVLCQLLAGCQANRFCQKNIGEMQIPREKEMYSLADYVIESPDVLLIDAVNVTPKPPYRIAPLDSLIIQVAGAFPTEPIGGLYPVEPGGTINLGLSYGTVSVAGKTIAEAKAAIEAQLKGMLKDNRAVVSLGQSRALQQIRGPHIVTPDGKVRLGIYGSVVVAGLTLPQAKHAIESHLGLYLATPEVSLDVAAYNSKVYYVVFDGGGNGLSIIRLPVTGNDTVLDALAQVGGLSSIADKDRIWVARPPAGCAEKDQIMPVDLVGIVSRGRTETNYQLFPGDRIFVKADSFIALNTTLDRVFAPLERIFGVSLLGRSVVGAFAQPLVQGTGSGSNVNSSLTGLPIATTSR